MYAFPKPFYTILIISVKDTGRGIKKENIEKLFTKFERLDVERNTTTEGTGLVLAITKKLVEMMGGKINVESSFGKGSIFMVTLPQKISKLEKIMSDKELEESRKKLTEREIANYQGKKVLIVDDNRLNIKVAKRAIADFNFEIDECFNGEECLKKTETTKYDLILMDIMMPVMSGDTTLKKLKEKADFKTPVIALTADAIAGAKEEYIKEGFFDYLAKPFSKEEIKVLLDKVFIKSKESKEKTLQRKKQEIKIIKGDIATLKENDIDVERALEYFDDIKTYNKMLKSWLYSQKNKTLKLIEAVNNNELDNIFTMIKNINNDAECFGFKRIEEETIKVGQMNDIRSNLNNLISLIEETETIIEKYLGI